MHELLNAEQMQAADAAAAASGIDSYELMRSAARAVARSVYAVAIPGAHVVVVAGPGNNGGDGAVAADFLDRWGLRVTLIRCGRTASVGDAARAFESWHGDTLSMRDAGARSGIFAAIRSADVIVDALFGAGLSRPLEGDAAELVAAINAADAYVVAVDLPSGLDGNRSQVLGSAAVRAARTVTFFRYKPVHFLMPSREYCGETELADIGIPDSVLASIGTTCWLNASAGWLKALPIPTAGDHKYRRGHVVVRGGPSTQTGAARLAAATALRCGAGAVTLTSPTAALNINAAQLTAVMLATCDDSLDWRNTITRRSIAAVVVGPGNGIGVSTRQCVEAALANHLPCVIDADAITSCAEQRESLFEHIHHNRASTVLTPHEGEFERLFSHLEGRDLPSRLHRARCAAAESGAVVVLKGADTVIAAPDGRARINHNAPPWLATAGAGDVLSGLIGALLAQGMNAFDAASAAVWLHGDAATALGNPLTAEQLVDGTGQSLHRVLHAPGNREAATRNTRYSRDFA